jgi:hypothetical protein
VGVKVVGSVGDLKKVLLPFFRGEGARGGGFAYVELKALVQRDGGAVTRTAEVVILLFEVLEKRRLGVED